MKIPAPIRREVATREGIKPGQRTEVACHWCGATTFATWPLRLDGKPTYWPLLGGFALDHLVPRSRGGLDEASNLVISCGRCNSSKRDRVIPAWLRNHSGIALESVRRPPWN